MNPYGAALLLAAHLVAGCTTLAKNFDEAASQQPAQVIRATLAYLKRSGIGCAQPRIQRGTFTHALTEVELFPSDQTGKRSRAELRQEFLEQHLAWQRINEAGEVGEALPKLEAVSLAEAALEAASVSRSNLLSKIDRKWLPIGMTLDDKDCGMMVFSPTFARGIWFVDTFLNRGEFGGAGFMFALRREPNGWRVVASRRSASVIV